MKSQKEYLMRQYLIRKVRRRMAKAQMAAEGIQHPCRQVYKPGRSALETLYLTEKPVGLLRIGNGMRRSGRSCCFRKLESGRAGRGCAMEPRRCECGAAQQRTTIEYGWKLRKDLGAGGVCTRRCFTTEITK